MAPTPWEAFERAEPRSPGCEPCRGSTAYPARTCPDRVWPVTSVFDGYGADRTFSGSRREATYTVQTEALGRLELLIEEAVRAGANRVDEVRFEVLDKPALRDGA